MEKDLNEDTLIISAASEDRIEPLSAINIQDIIADLDLGKYGLDTDNMTISGGGSFYQYNTAAGNNQYSTVNLPQINAQGSAGGSQYATINIPPINAGGYSFHNTPQWTSTGPGALHVEGDAEFKGDIKWKGRSLGEMLTTIERRLAILVPNQEKLEHFEALKKAYEHYKTLEALCEVPKKEDDQ